MPTSSQTQAGTTRPANCTRTAGTFSAGDLAVCRAGDMVALHFGTPEGRFIFRIRERVFIRSCRGAVDHNGNPFRSLDDLQALGCGEVEQLQSDAAATPALPPIVSVSSGSVQQRRDAAWSALQRDPAQALADVAHDFGLTEFAFSFWLTNAHRGELRELRRAAGVSLCPRRRPQNLATTAARGEPLAKPSGGIA